MPGRYPAACFEETETEKEQVKDGETNSSVIESNLQSTMHVPLSLESIRNEVGDVKLKVHLDDDNNIPSSIPTPVLACAAPSDDDSIPMITVSIADPSNFDNSPNESNEILSSSPAVRVVSFATDFQAEQVVKRGRKNTLGDRPSTPYVTFESVEAQFREMIEGDGSESDGESDDEHSLAKLEEQGMKVQYPVDFEDIEEGGHNISDEVKLNAIKAHTKIEDHVKHHVEFTKQLLAEERESWEMIKAVNRAKQEGKKEKKGSVF